MSRSQMRDIICMALGGHAAEEVLIGEIFTGSSSDLKQATEMCRQMVTKYGMSEKLGTIYLGSDNEVFVGMEFGQSRPYSEKYASMIDEEVKQMLDECYERAKETIRTNLEQMNRLVDTLLTEETVGRNEFVAIMEGREADASMDEDKPREAARIPVEPAPEPAREEKTEDKPELPSSFIPEDSLNGQT